MTKGEKSLMIDGSGSQKGNEIPRGFGKSPAGKQGPLPLPVPIDGNMILEYLEGIGNQMLEINTRMLKEKELSKECQTESPEAQALSATSERKRDPKNDLSRISMMWLMTEKRKDRPH